MSIQNCSICSEPLSPDLDIIEAHPEEALSHLFHRACLQTAIEISTSVRCPLCRRAVTTLVPDSIRRAAAVAARTAEALAEDDHVAAELAAADDEEEIDDIEDVEEKLSEEDQALLDFVNDALARGDLDAVVDGRTPLHAAIELIRGDLVKELIRRGADVQIVDSDGWNALEFAYELHDRTREDWKASDLWNIAGNLSDPEAVRNPSPSPLDPF